MRPSPSSYLPPCSTADSCPFAAAGAKKSKLARKVDKYGRPLDNEASVNELKRYYRMASPSADDAQADAGEGEGEGEGEGAEGEDDDDDEQSAEEEDEEDEPARPGFVDLARGEVLLESSDEEAVSDAESDSSSRAGSVRLGGRAARRRPSRSPSIDLSETEPASLFPDEDDSAGELDDDDDEQGAEPSRRLAIVNMDWDHLRASDLYRVLASCLSATAASIQQRKQSANDNRDAVKIPTKLAIAPGRLKTLRIYPSQFGRERMEREAVEGPPVDVLRAKGAETSDEDDDDGGKTLKLGRKDKGKQRRRRADSGDDEFTTNDLIDEQLQEGDDYDTEALRKYQLERLRCVQLSRLPGLSSYSVGLSLTRALPPQVLLRHRDLRLDRVGQARRRADQRDRVRADGERLRPPVRLHLSVLLPPILFLAL